MTGSMVGEWSNRKVKRSLSTFEKSSVLSNSNIAIGLFGQPGSAENPGEYEELLQIGFEEANIFGFERNSEAFIHLQKVYGPNIIKGQIEKKIHLIHDQSVDYFHLDLMGPIARPLYGSAKNFAQVLKHDARFRITVSKSLYTRASKHQSIVIYNIFTQHFINSCKLANINTYKLDSVISKFNNHFKTSEIFEGFFADFGIAMFLYTMFYLRMNFDPLDQRHNDLVSNISKEYIKRSWFKLDNINKIQYKDPRFMMLTTWCDVKRIKCDSYVFLNDICDYILKSESEYVCK